MDTALTSSIGAMTSDVISGFSTVTSFWFVPVIVGVFIVTVVIGLIANFFNKRGKRKGKK